MAALANTSRIQNAPRTVRLGASHQTKEIMIMKKVVLGLCLGAFLAAPALAMASTPTSTPVTKGDDAKKKGAKGKKDAKGKKKEGGEEKKEGGE
jgi:hypothetical protein